MSPRILVIDDEPETTAILRRLLTRRGFVVAEENESTHALHSAHAFQPHVVILDYAMPICHGGDVAWQLWCDPFLREVKVIMCTGVPEADFRLKLPPRDIPILTKPIDGEALVHLIRGSLGDLGSPAGPGARSQPGGN